MSIIVFLSIVSDTGSWGIEGDIRQYREEAAEISKNAKMSSKEYTQMLIEEETASYILDKAKTLGADRLSVRAAADMKNGDWIISEVIIEGSPTDEQKCVLSDYITNEMGVPPAEQKWIFTE